MNWIFRYTGALFIMICVFFINRGYREYLERGAKVRAGFIELINRLRHKIDCYMSTVPEAIEDFVCLPIEELLSSVRDGEQIGAAFARMKNKFRIGREGEEILDRFFSDVTVGYKDTVVSAAVLARERLVEYDEKMRAEDEKSAKITASLLFGLGLGTVILLI